MIKTVALLSLSSGLLGEKFIKHEYDIGIKRLSAYGLNIKKGEHALKGIDHIKNHPGDRAKDLLSALGDDSVDMIITAIGGDDTYRLLPYLFDNDELKAALQSSSRRKIFLGFSDTTWNHFMLHKLGFNTFYGQCFIADICELDNKMLPYTKKYFEELINTGGISEIRPSDVWYEEREDFSEAAASTSRISHKNNGFELLQGSPEFSGEILGGCIDSIYDMFDNSRYADTSALCEKYALFPALDDWRGKILLLESSEEKPSPELFEKMLKALKDTGIFSVINGVIVGKPMDETYYEDYKEILVKVIANDTLPILYNVNIGHATPRCIIPFGVHARVNADEQWIRF